MALARPGMDGSRSHALALSHGPCPPRAGPPCVVSRGGFRFRRLPVVHTCGNFHVHACAALYVKVWVGDQLFQFAQDRPDFSIGSSTSWEVPQGLWARKSPST